jgi:thiosulfate dehydrogenase [quinone] large subunit
MVAEVSEWSDRLPGVALLVARLYVGQHFLQTGFGKISRGFLSGGALMPQLERFLASTPHAWYKAWLVNVVIPHEHVFAILTALGETLAGVALFLGALTRFAAGVGTFMVGNYLFAKGWSNPASFHDKAFIALLLVVLIGGAGRYWGLDGWWRWRHE